MINYNTSNPLLFSQSKKCMFNRNRTIYLSSIKIFKNKYELQMWRGSDSKSRIWVGDHSKQSASCMPEAGCNYIRFYPANEFEVSDTEFTSYLIWIKLFWFSARYRRQNCWYFMILIMMSKYSSQSYFVLIT